MKKIIAFTLVLACLLGFGGCSQKPEEPAVNEPEPLVLQNCNTKWDGKSLKLLCVGNSYAYNGVKVLHQIAKAHGVEEIVIGILYIGGCTVDTHWEKAQSGEAAYKYYKNTTGTWDTIPNYTMIQGIQDEDWDIVTITQGSGHYGLKDKFTKLVNLVDYIKENLSNPEAQFAYHMSWAFHPDCELERFTYFANDQSVMYQSILDVTQNVVLPSGVIDFILPSGTAIQNARTALGNTFCLEDHYHLNSVGEYVAGYTWFASLTGQAIEELKYLEDSVIGPMKSTHKPILDAVNAAVSNPFQLTQISK